MHIVTLGECILKYADKYLKSIEKRLVNLDQEIAEEYLLWLDRKTEFFLESLEKQGYQTQPDDLNVGDVIWVEFGINVGTELSDYKTKGHYAVVIGLDLGNVIVVPLSSRDGSNSSLTFDLGVIEGLNYKNQHSYLKVDAIRSVSKRRIGRMVGKENGKISLNKETFKKVKLALKMAFNL